MFLELYLGHCGNTKYERPIFLTFGDFCVSWKKKQGEADVWALYFSSQGSVNHVISLQWLSGTFPRSSYSYGRVEKQKYFWLGEKCVFVGDNCCGAAFVVGVKNFIWSSRFQFIRWSFFFSMCEEYLLFPELGLTLRDLSEWLSGSVETQSVSSCWT